MADDWDLGQEITTVDQINLRPVSFEKAKNQLKEFSENSRSKCEINHVKTGRILSHRVTGEELNTALTEVQTYLIRNNEDVIDVSRQIGHVYEAMESLDKEYIPGILTAVKGAEYASNQAKSASEHAKHAQQDIKKTVEEQKKIIKVLENHKDKLDKLKHLDNIDEIWRTSQELEQELKQFTESFQRSKDRLSKLDESLKALQRFAEGILDYEHLEDIDDTWEKVESIEGIIDQYDIKIEEMFCNIKEIGQTINTLNSFEHLKQIDTIWFDLEDAKNNIEESSKQVVRVNSILNQIKSRIDLIASFKSQMEKVEHLFDIDEIYESTQIVTEKVDDLLKKNNRQDLQLEDLKKILEQEREQTHIFSDSILKKIKHAYIIASCSIGLSIISFILLIVGVI